MCHHCPPQGSYFIVLVEEKYVAMYNFEGKDEECLTLKEGDVVVVTNKNDSGWWTGSLDGKTGVFPGSYVKEVPPEVDFQKSKTSFIGTRLSFIGTRLSFIGT